VKSAAGGIQTATKRILGLRGAGKSLDTFLRDTLAPCIAPVMETYKVLRQDIFGR